MAPRLDTVPRHRVEAALRAALAEPWLDASLLPLNWGEWQRIDRLYRPLLEDLAQRVHQARSAEEIDALARIAEGVVEQRRAELQELHRYLDPPSRHEPEGSDSALVGLAAARAVAEVPSARGDGEHGAQEAEAAWEPLVFVGLLQLRAWLTDLRALFSDPAGQVALAAQLGFPFVASHTSAHQLAQRLLLEALLQPADPEQLLRSPIPARYRPPWDLWLPRRGIVGSVQPDLSARSLAGFGTTLLWSRIEEASDGLGYLVVSIHIEPRRQQDSWFSADEAGEYLRRQRWQQMRLQAMLPRPGRKTAAHARSVIEGLRAALGRLVV